MPKQSGADQNPAAVLNLVLGYLAVKDIEAIEEKVEVLTRLGYKNDEMAKICGTTSGSIKSFKYLTKNKSTKKKKKVRSK